MWHIPALDPLVFGWLRLADLAPVRAVCRGWRARLGAGRHEVWAGYRDPLGKTWTYMLRHICRRGHLAAAQWLVAAFDLTADNTPTDGLLQACVCADLPVVVWAAGHFGLTISGTELDGTFAYVCLLNKLPVALWLADRFRMTAANIRMHYTQALRNVCRRGFLTIALWLADRFGLTADDARAGGDQALAGACRNGHQPTARWLAIRFGLTSSDVAAVREWLKYQDRSAAVPNGMLLWLPERQTKG